MTLTALKTKLQTLVGTAIGEVLFDWKISPNHQQEMTYPYLIWAIDGSSFTDDYRTATNQKVKIFTFTLYAVARYSDDTDKITVWDTLEGQVKTYLNAMNDTTGIQIFNINEIKGKYAGEGLISANKEIGMIFENVQVKCFC